MLHALVQRQPAERLVDVLDSECVFKAIVEWLVKWRRHGWRCSTGEVGHRDLWEQILTLWERGGEQVQVRWVPSHREVRGNEEAGALAWLGGQLHPSTLVPLSKRRRVTEWDSLGLEAMEGSPSLLTSGMTQGIQGRPRSSRAHRQVKSHRMNLSWTGSPRRSVTGPGRGCRSLARPHPGGKLSTARM